MMLVSYHVHKDEVRLAWLDNRDQIKLDLRKLMRRVENEVLNELDSQFVSAINSGKILELRPGEESLRKLIVNQAKALDHPS